MRPGAKVALVLAAVVGVAGLLVALPVGASPSEQATSIRRSYYPWHVDTAYSGAASQVDQDGSGSILNLQDGGSSEYTFDQSSATFTNLLTLSGGLTAGGAVIYGTATPATVVTGTALAPGALLNPIAIATAGTVPLTIPAAGRYVCVWNTGSQAVTIADTGNQVMAGNFAMGQYDVLCGISDGTRFIEISRSNN